MYESMQETAHGPMGRRTGRAQRSLGRLWQVPTFLAGVAALMGVAASAPLREDPGLRRLEEDLAQLRSWTQDPMIPADRLVAGAENLVARLPQFTRRGNEIHFLAGTAYYRQAESLKGSAAQEARLKALSHLQEAWNLGVAPEDHPAMMFRLGETLFRVSDKEKDRKWAIRLMTESIEGGADRPGEAYGILLEAHLSLTRPDWQAALAASRKQLEMTDDRVPAAMGRARLRYAELLVRGEKRREALKELERIRADVPRELRLQARLLQTNLCAAEGLWGKAIPLWKELLPDAQHVPGGKGRILYHLGKCLALTEPPQPTAAVAAWQEASRLGGDEALAAGLYLGKLHLLGPTPEPAAGLQAWTNALAALRSPQEFPGYLVPLQEVRAWFEAAIRLAMDQGEHVQAETLAVLYMKVAVPGRGEHLTGTALQAQANAARDVVAGLPAGEPTSPEAAKQLENARSLAHRAGVAHERAAMLGPLGRQAEHFWDASRAYLGAADHARAEKVLEKFVGLEKDETKLAEAWLRIAESRQALGAKDKALQAYYKCIEYPNTPFACRARYRLALAEIDKKNVENAIAILQQNLTPEAHRLDPAAHESSSYTIADLHLKLRLWDKAALYLKEASRQYPTNPAALATRDRLADCYRKLAEIEASRLKAASTPDLQAHYRRKRNGWLEQAAEVCQRLLDDLERKGTATLDAAEQALYRRALFGAADARFDMSEFAEALRRYESIQPRFRKKIEGLVACQRIWRCVGVMVGSPAESRTVREAARKAVVQARADLAEMPADSEAFKGGPGVWSREDWNGWLNWVADQLEPATARKGTQP